MLVTSNYIEKSKYLREMMVKIELKGIDIQKRVIVEVLLDSNSTSFVISLEFVRK